MQTQAGEVGAVVLRAGSRYVTFGSVPAADSLEVLRVEKVPVEWMPQGDTLETGHTVTFPLRQSGEGVAPMAVEEQTLPAEAREVWANYERDGLSSYQSLRKVCSEQGLSISAQPSTEEMLDGLMEAGVAPPAPATTNNVEQAVVPDKVVEAVQYTPVDLYQGIQQAEGKASEEALSTLESQVKQYKKKAAVVEDYLAISDEDSPFEEVRDVAEEHGCHWRTVHRYVDDLVGDEERILKA